MTATQTRVARHTRSALHDTLARVQGPSRPLAALYLAGQLADADDARPGATDTVEIPAIRGDIAAPAPSRRARAAHRWTRIRRSRFADDLRGGVFAWAVIIGLGVLALVAIHDLNALAPVASAQVNL